MRTNEITCPCCKARITINMENGNILHHEEFKKGPAQFDDFLSAQKSRKEAIAQKFEESKLKSQTRLKSIEEKIAWAQKRDQNLDP